MSFVNQSLLDSFLTFVTILVDVAAGLIISISVLRATYYFLTMLYKSREERTIQRKTVRIELVSGLLLGIDFEVGSDVLRSILLPDYADLLALGVVIALRVVLSWSLTREIAAHEGPA